MKRRTRRSRPIRTALFSAAGIAMLSAAGFLLAEHAAAVLEVREVSLPLVAEIPQFERRIAVLTDQVEMAELHAATSFGSQEESVNVYVLPEDIDFDRLLAVFDILGEELRDEKLLTEISEITMSDLIPAQEEGLSVRSVSMKFAAHEDGVQMFLSLVKLAGLLTIGDTLSAEERLLLLQKTEEENPAGVVAIEQFFSTDLLRYAREPKTYETQLLRSFSSPSFTKTIEDTLQSPLLRDARRILGGAVGTRLQQYNLWPLPLMVLSDVRIHAGGAPGWFVLLVTVNVYSRGND